MGCAVTIADPAIEAHHALLEIDEDGVELVQLAGRLPVRLAKIHLEIGDTRMDLRPPAVGVGLVLGVTNCDPLTGGGGEPAVIDADSLAIVDDHPEFIHAHAIVRSLASQADALGLTTPDWVFATSADALLDDYPALLEIGARWRARWTTHDSTVRLHAAGRASRVREQRRPAFGDLPAFLGSLEPVGELADSVRHVGIA